MDKDDLDLREVAADLRRIREAVRKSDGLMSFIDIGGALKGILLAGGLLIAVFAAIFYFLLQRHGSFGAIPENTRTVLFILIGITWTGVGYVKVRNFIRGARNIGADLNLYKLAEEIYTPRLLALLLPYLAVITLAIVFLDSRGYSLLIIPALAVLVGLLTVSLSSLFFMKEVFLLGIWLAATGLLTLFIAEAIHPLAALGITFAAGFILTSLLMYLGLPGEKR